MEVKSREEILSTLDSKGCLDSLPFMPEMFAFCGSRVRVYKRAHKTCDTINFTGGRRMESAVHLAGVRCDGQAHGGCQAECLIFWKEAWLKRVAGAAEDGAGQARSAAEPVGGSGKSPGRSTVPDVSAAACEHRPPEEPVFFCQATNLLRATAPLPWWDVRQYWEDYASGNVTLKLMVNALCYSGYLKLFGIPWLGKWFKRLYNRVQRVRGRPRHPRSWGRIPVDSPTPAERLDLQPGELVRVKNFEAILDTIDQNWKNRGLKWDAEMVPYCGGTYRVRRRVEQIIDEKTGKMLRFKSAAIMLEGVVCRAQYSECRYFCPRSIYSYWREIWLERASAPPMPGLVKSA